MARSGVSWSRWVSVAVMLLGAIGAGLARLEAPVWLIVAALLAFASLESWIALKAWRRENPTWPWSSVTFDCDECGRRVPEYFTETVEAGGIFSDPGSGPQIIERCLYCMRGYPYPSMGESASHYKKTLAHWMAEQKVGGGQ